MFLERGFVFSHETVRHGEAVVAPLLTAQLRQKKWGKAGKRWHADETYVRIQGMWCYLYRAIDVDSNLVDSMLSMHCDRDMAKRFFALSVEVVGHAPAQVTTDGHDAYPRAIRETLGPEVVHRSSRYKNTVLEQDHRGITQRDDPVRGFGSCEAAARFCSAHDEVRDHFRSRRRRNETMSLSEQRCLFQERWGEVRVLMQAA